jgi:CubicO group peptidase (beta-lactamase class C family)
MFKLCTLVMMVIFLISALPVSAAGLIEVDSAEIDRFIEQEMQVSRIPGLALGIVYKGEPVYMKGYGTAGKGRPATAQTPFIIGSVSKSFTALAAMQLVEDGKLDLDRPVQDYLPWFSMAGDYDSGEITVRHLLVQTSGIPNEAGVTSLARSSTKTTEEEVRALSKISLVSRPGDSYIYSNANYNILGLLIDEVSDEGYVNHVREKIFEPLGMQNSHLSRSEGLGAGMADGYTKFFGFPLAGEVQYLDNSLAAGFIISTAEDMCHYLLMHLNGGRYEGNSILSEAGLTELYRPGQVRAGESKYAMGLVAIKDESDTLIMHDGGTQGFNSGMVFSPNEQWGVIVLTNVGTMVELPAMPLAIGVADLIRNRTPDTGSKTARNYYLAGLALIIGLLVLTVRSIVLLPKKWVVKIETNRPQGLLPVLLRFALPVILEAALPLLVFLIIPRGAGFPVWRLLGLYHPDLIWGLLILSGLLLVKAFWRLFIIFKTTMKTA